MPEIDDFIPGVDDSPVFRRVGPGGSVREDLVVGVLVVVMTVLFMVVAVVKGPFEAEEESLEDRATAAFIVTVG